MGDDEYREGLAEKGLDRSRDFRWRLAAEKTLELYREILAGTKGSAPPGGRSRPEPAERSGADPSEADDSPAEDS
jgi:hypothetical protein